MDFLNYGESFLNPLLKLLVVILFVIGTIFFFRARMRFGGDLKTIATMLTLTGVAGVVSGFSRFIGDYVLIWKWSESVFMLTFAVVSFSVGYLILMLFRGIDLPE